MRLFSETTVFVKCWATRKGIYSFNLGFLNGISIMILVAKAMQSFIDRCHASQSLSYRFVSGDYNMTRQKFIEHFFATFAQWPWDSENYLERVVYLVYP